MGKCTEVLPEMVLWIYKIKTTPDTLYTGFWGEDVICEKGVKLHYSEQIILEVIRIIMF